MKDLAIFFKENTCKHVTYLKTRKKSLPAEKKLGRKYNKFHFREKNEKYGVIAGIFHEHAITKHSLIRYRITHNLIDLSAKKGVTFLFISLVLSLYILDILLLAVRLRLIVIWCKH